MNAVIFDIDGTLTNTNQVDTDCFIRAMQDVFSIRVDITDWRQYKTVTDSGVTAEIFQKNFARLPSADELTTLKNHFVTLLKKSFEMNPNLFHAVAGADTILGNLQENKQWVVAIATGCWKPSALLKLQLAEINHEAVPAAFSEDAISREDIIKIALERTKNRYGLKDLEKIVYVGDGIWDVRAAKKLQIGFIGLQIDRGDNLLQKEGVRDIFANFLDYGEFVCALERAVMG
jgi:phosphoglycolate phosphatase-like HAD superfamily hydrolase